MNSEMLIALRESTKLFLKQYFGEYCEYTNDELLRAFIIILIFLYSPRACMNDCWSEDASVCNTVIKKLLPINKF